MERIEWATMALIGGFYVSFLAATTAIHSSSALASILLLSLLIALFASIQHEVIHGHPTPFRGFNEALVFPGITVLIPFKRFRDTHIEHHIDARLTDPFDDPESNFMYEREWGDLSKFTKLLLSFNNTLIGRLTIGVVVAQTWFMATEFKKFRAGQQGILSGWIWHVLSVSIVIFYLIAVEYPIWHYLIAAYLGNSLVKIRTFAEHQAHEISKARTVIIEDQGLLSFLFLNNNLHAVHHERPGVPWFDLPKLYRRDREGFLRENDGYSFSSYWSLFVKYGFTRKDPVAHPLWKKAGDRS